VSCYCTSILFLYCISIDDHENGESTEVDYKRSKNSNFEENSKYADDGHTSYNGYYKPCNRSNSRYGRKGKVKHGQYSRRHQPRRSKNPGIHNHNQPFRSSRYNHYSRNDRRSSFSPPHCSHSKSDSSSIDDEIGHFYGEIGDKIDNRYEIGEVLGKGTFGKVFRCKDYKYKNEGSVAIKVVRNISKYIDSAKIESKILKNIFYKQQEVNKNYCCKMFSSFSYQGSSSENF
jgi:hypothetical protein